MKESINSVSDAKMISAQQIVNNKEEDSKVILQILNQNNDIPVNLTLNVEGMNRQSNVTLFANESNKTGNSPLLPINSQSIEQTSLNILP